MNETSRKAITVRLTDEDLTLLPEGESYADSIRRAIIERGELQAKVREVEPEIALLSARIAALPDRETIAKIADLSAMEARLHAVFHEAFEQREALFAFLLKVEAIAMTALDALNDADADMEELRARADARDDALREQNFKRYCDHSDRARSIAPPLRD